MAVEEALKKQEEIDMKMEACKKCIWGRKITNDKQYDILNIMCMFNQCIKDKKD